MTRAEAITIIKREYSCVNRNCDIERSCGKCDLVMPDKEPILEAYKMAIKALEQEPFINKPCVSSGVCEYDKNKVLDKIRAELHATAEMHEDGDYYLRDEWIDEYFDKYKAESEE